MQFIFDRVKDSDPFKLNEIYSHVKKYRQCQSTKQEREKAKKQLEEAIKNSELPDILKTNRDYKNEAVFTESSFLHLVCKYYKWRQRAKDGRIFIHPKYRYVKGRGYENTGRFDDRNCLLIYCNHKPRQKRYQMLGDLAGVLQISPQKLKQFIAQKINFSDEDENEKIFHWLDNIRSFKTNCAKAAKEQKDRRGRLKLDIQIIYNLIYHKTKDTRLSDSKKDKQIKQILEKSRVDKAFELYKLCEKTKSLYLKLVNELYDESRQIKVKKELCQNHANAVYFLAQINNIVFKERNGNATTCVVCSMDNAHRMQTGKKEEIEDIRAKAQRLPAISTRIIDGAVMKMARIVGGAIAKDKWEIIKPELEKGNKVCVPIITESNRFEFEPDLKILKGKSPDDKDKKYKTFDPLKDKGNRIKEAGQGICPYTDEPVGDIGEIDHIIPRSAGWGVLNDEANLIWASAKGNNTVKKEQIFSLEDLKSGYKTKQFKTSDIEGWIIAQIGDGTREEFKFGKYRSFINLNPNEQKAFRHALFLKRNHPLRNKVIKAIDNRTRTLVNGTQRYFVEVLANNLYKKVLAWNAENKDKNIDLTLLGFDYFGIEAWDSTRGNGIRDLRKELVEFYRKDLRKFDKSDGESSQEPYSHLLDAQIAFCMVVCEHQKDGSFKLNLQENGLGLWSRVDRGTGEIKMDKKNKTYDASLFNTIQVSEGECELKLKKLSRRKSYTVETHHRQLIEKGERLDNSISYKIHRDGMIAERFFPLLECSDKELRKGFTKENSASFKGVFEDIKPFIKKTDNKIQDCNIWIVNKRKVQRFLMDIGYKGADSKEEKIAKILDDLSYQVVKKEISSVLAKRKKPSKTVKEAKERWAECISEKKFTKDKVILPIYNEWEKLKKELEVAEDPEQNLQDFLSKSNFFKNKQISGFHNKTRKVFSLPTVTGIGNIRIKRKSWNGNNIIQISPEESIAQYGYGYESKQRPHTILSKNSIPKKHYSGMPKSWEPQPLKWIDVPEDDIKDKKILSAKIKFQDANRCIVKLTTRSIHGLSLPQNKNTWKGKVVRHNSKSNLKEENDKDNRGKYHHCLESDYQWFDKPFGMSKERNNVTLNVCSGGYNVEFTISRTKEIKKWLLIEIKYETSCS